MSWIKVDLLLKFSLEYTEFFVYQLKEIHVKGLKIKYKFSRGNQHNKNNSLFYLYNTFSRINHHK